MKKGIDALTQAVVTGAIVPTNEAQRAELAYIRSGLAKCAATVPAANHAPDLLATLRAIVEVLNQPVQHTGSADATRILRQDARAARAFALAAIARAEGGAK